MYSLKRVGLTTLGIVLSLLYQACAQTPATSKPWGRVMFYNTENLFDTIDDPLRDDAQFLPGAKANWNGAKYNTKLKHIGEVVEKAGFPVLVGFSEVENDTVLNDLVKQKLFADKKYKVVHYNSPDERGIDVALIYRSDIFTLKGSQKLPVTFPTEPEDRTRDVLYVRGTLKGETVHIMVNHWPSRSEGEEKTRHRRMAAAQVVRRVVDSLTVLEKEPQFIIMGDFNDHPNDESIKKGLLTADDQKSITATNLYNLAERFATEGKGTHKYKGEWGTLDQLIVTGALLTVKGIYTKVDAAHIAEYDFLLEPDTKNGGNWPRRTYAGDKYLDGYSDHLPIYLDLYKK